MQFLSTANLSTTKLSSVERWRQNVPCDDRPRWHLRPLATIVISIILILFTHNLQAQERIQPLDLVVFTTPNCGPCVLLKQDVEKGAFPGYQVSIVGMEHPLYREFEAACALSEYPLPPGQVGVLGKRPNTPCFPVVWIRGEPNHWCGYEAALRPNLQRYLADEWQRIRQLNGGWRASSPRSQPVATPVSVPLPVVPPVVPAADVTSTLPPVPPFAADGVHVIVTISNLTTQMPDLRADVARRANRALGDLVRQHLGDKASAHIVAEVADPQTFNAVCRATGVRPGANGIPVACQILIPERFSGLQGMLVKRAELALHQHFLVPLQACGISVIIERIHGETYGAVLEAISGDQPRNSSPLDPENTIPFGVAAWLSERSNLARRLLAALGLIKD